MNAKLEKKKEMKNENERLILVSNDDGYNAAGIRHLIEVASDYGYVIAVAPSTHQSGKSSSLTMDTPLRAEVVEETERYKLISVNGTPVDCTKLALNVLLPRRPDLILSGINHGYNSGVNVIYSGTMGVVFEGCLQGIDSIGFSYGDYRPKTDFTPCDAVMRSTIEYVLEHGLPAGVGLNVNIPVPEGGEVKGIKITRASSGRWAEEYDERVDPYGKKYYWLTGYLVNDDADNAETDMYWLERGYASITPCSPDQSNLQVMESLRKEFQ